MDCRDPSAQSKGETWLIIIRKVCQLKVVAKTKGDVNMEFSAFPQGDWSAFSQISQSVADIDEKCLKIVERLKQAFADDSMIGAGVCSIDITQSAHELAIIKSPVGNGRVVRRWSRNRRELYATLLFQREQFDNYDQRCWETVWGITVPRYEAAHSGTGEKALRIDLDGFLGNPRNMVFAAAMSILAALVDGPQQITAECP